MLLFGNSANSFIEP